jgi:hypothetical protein
MEQPFQPKRCPHCNALVVDRRSPVCTTCREALPAEWVMTKEQAATVTKLDAQARALHKQEMRMIDPSTDPDAPAILRILGRDSPGGF